MTSITQPSPAAKGDPRTRLLEGLAQSLREKGLARTQISDIVRHARTSKRTFYECFPDKESAFVELIRAGSAANLIAVEEVVASDEPWAEQVDRAVDVYLQALTDDPILVAAISRELPALGTRGADLQREAIDRFADLFVRISRERAPDNPEVRPFTPDTAVMAVGGIAELIARASHEGRPLTELAPTIKEVVKAVMIRVP